MSNTEKPKILKTKLFQNESGSLVISKYPFTVEKTDEFGTISKQTYDLVEIAKTKKVWSDEIKSYFDKKSFVTISLDDLKDILTSLEVKAL